MLSVVTLCVKPHGILLTSVVLRLRAHAAQTTVHEQERNRVFLRAGKNNLPHHLGSEVENPTSCLDATTKRRRW